MAQFDLTKFLAEGKLYEAMFDVEATTRIAQHIADAFTAEDSNDLDLKYVVSPDVEAGHFNLDVEAGENTPGEDWKDENGFDISNYLGQYAGGSFRIKDGVVLNSAMRSAPVANVSPEGEVEMISAKDSRADLDAQDNIPAIDRMYNSDAWVQAQRDMMEAEGEVMVDAKLLASYIDAMLEYADEEYTPNILKSLKGLKSKLSGKMSVKDALDFVKKTIDITGDDIDAIEALGQATDYDDAVIAQARKIMGIDENKKPNKMKKSELKEMIKAAMLAEYEKDVNVTDENPESEEDFLAETQNPEVLAMVELIMDALGPERFLDELISAMDTSEAMANLKHIIQMWDLDGGLYEAKDEEVDVEAAAEETETDSEETTDVAVDSEETIDTETTTEVDPNVKATQDALTQAIEAAKKLGDKKLEAQIGNTITFFTRSHVVGDGAGAEGAVAENTKEYYKDAEADDAEHIDALEKDMADDKESSLKIGEVMFPMWTKLKK